MADREKLIELIDLMPLHEGKTFEEALADHLIANGVVVSIFETATRWIPVTERLPKAGETVLVYGSRGGVYTAYMFHPNLWHKLNSKSHYCKPTHWMSLPEPPKGE